MAREAQGLVEGTVESAKPLPEEQRRAIESTVAKTVGKKVVLATVINPDLLGGVRVRVGNTLFDGSVATACGSAESIAEARAPSLCAGH